VELSDADGNTYYFNQASQESRWTKPTAEMLPDGWVRMVDDEGTAYYFNTYSGESQWDVPSE
jgi:YHS domain-containing protein